MLFRFECYCVLIDVEVYGVFAVCRYCFGKCRTPAAYAVAGVCRYCGKDLTHCCAVSYSLYRYAALAVYCTALACVEYYCKAVSLPYCINNLACCAHCCAGNKSCSVCFCCPLNEVILISCGFGAFCYVIVYCLTYRHVYLRYCAVYCVFCILVEVERCFYRYCAEYIVNLCYLLGCVYYACKAAFVCCEAVCKGAVSVKDLACLYCYLCYERFLPCFCFVCYVCMYRERYCPVRLHQVCYCAAYCYLAVFIDRFGYCKGICFYCAFFEVHSVYCVCFDYCTCICGKFRCPAYRCIPCQRYCCRYSYILCPCAAVRYAELCYAV